MSKLSCVALLHDGEKMRRYDTSSDSAPKNTPKTQTQYSQDQANV